MQKKLHASDISSQAGNQARLVVETTSTQTSTPLQGVASQGDTMNAMTEQYHQATEHSFSSTNLHVLKLRTSDRKHMSLRPKRTD